MDFVISFVQKVQPFLETHGDVILMCFGFALVARAIRRSRLAAVRSNADPPAAAADLQVVEPRPAEPQPIVAQESVERLREVHAPWASTATLAYEFLSGEILSGAKPTEDKGVIGALVREKVLPPCREAIEQLNARMLPVSGDLSNAEFSLLKEDFRSLVYTTYPELVAWIHQCGHSFWGDNALFSSVYYARLCRKHHDSVAILRAVSGRSDIGDLAGASTQIERLLPPLSELPHVGRITSLMVEPLLENLAYAWPNYQTAPNVPPRVFAVIRVTNEGQTDFADVVARCSVTTSGVEIDCVWSNASGNIFVLGGSHRAELKRGDYRLLVVAQAIEKHWCRIPARHGVYEYPFRTESGTGEVNYYLPSSGTSGFLDLGPDVELTLRFIAEGLDQKQRVQLGFDAKGQPTTSVVP